MQYRRVCLGGWSEARPEQYHTCLTPNESAARTLGVEHLSLENLALQVLGAERIAHPLAVQRLLRRAVEEALGSSDPAGVAGTLLPPIRELFRAGADVDVDPGSPRTRRVMEVARAYRTLLRTEGLIDPAEALWEAAQTSPDRRPVVVWGYPRLGSGELVFIDAVAGEGSIVRLPHGEDHTFDENLEAAEELKRCGWVIERVPSQTVWRMEMPVEAHVYPHLEAEVRGVLAQVKVLLADGVPLDDIVVVARDDASYGPTVLSVAREYGVPVQALYRVPVSDTRVGYWLDLLFEAMAGGFPFETTARFLAHPLGPGIPSGRWARARKVHPKGDEAWEEVGVDLSSLVWPEENTRSGWIDRFGELFEAYALDRKVISWPREVAALAAAKAAVGWLGEPAEETISRERFVEEVEEVLRSTSTPAHPAREGVALHTPLSLYGARYRHVFTMGLTEGGFPPSVADDPALDFHERKRLRERGIRLELADERARRERLSFWTLLQVPQERLVLSYPKLVGGREALPSPYFGLVGIEPASPGPLPAASAEEARRVFLQRGNLEEDAVLGRTRSNWEVERRREGSTPFDHYDGVLGIPVDYGERPFSVSELGDLARCGFRWWSRSVLGLREPEEGEPPALIGSLYHRTLEIAARDAEGSEDVRLSILENLEAALEEAERELEMGRVRGWVHWREVYLAQLERAVRADDFALPGAEVVQTEAHFAGEWQGFEVVGRVDRLDRTPEGLVFVDYKSTASAPKPDLQLSVYREAAAPALFPGEPVQDAYYYSLRRAERIKAKEPSAGALESMAEEMKTNLREGRLPPDVLQRVCSFCEFDLVCRRGPRLDRKETEAT
jgi:RecB family exonuclease